MKRIICSILVVVMLALSLASCGYNIADDDMTDYATFSDADKKAFEAALAKILIEDGEFTTVDKDREDAVKEMIYSAVAGAMGSDVEKLTEGVPNGRDLIYYSYYLTADYDGTTAYFYTSKMDSTAAVAIQLLDGDDFGDDELSQKIADILSKHDFKDMAYLSTKSGNAVEGDIAYVTYTKTVGANEPVTYTNEKIVIGKDKGTAENASSFASHLCGAKIGSSSAIKEYTETDAEGNKVTYTSAKINFVINRITSGIATEGKKAYVSYTKKVGTEDATMTTNELMIVGKAPAEGAAAATIAELISGKEIGKKLVKDDENKTEYTVETTDDKGVKTVYSAITVNWIEGDGKELAKVEHDPFEEKTLVKDVAGVERDLNKGENITYYIYPVNYVDVPEYTAEFLVEKIILDALAETASSNSATQEELHEQAVDALAKLIFADRYAKLYYNEETTSEDIEALVDELVADANKKYVGKYLKKDADGKEVSEDVNFSEAVKLIVAYYKDIEDAEKAKEDANQAVADARKALDDAKAELEDKKTAGASADEIKALEDKVKAADEALNGKAGEKEDAKTGAIANRDRADAAYDATEKKKGENIKFLLGMTADGVTLSKTFYDGYRIEQYYSLQYSYNEEIKTKLGEEIYFFITENVKMIEGELPSELVDDAYTKLYESYENEFYTGTDSESKESNYKTYGSFEKFLVAKVNENEDIKEALAKDAKSFGDAKDILYEYAEYITVPVVKVFRFADAYDMTISDSDYEDYKNEIEDYYYKLYGIRGFDIEEIYGENSLKMAAQLDKILDWLLEYKESEGTLVDVYTKIEYQYQNKLLGQIVFTKDGETPASKAEK